jgi:hypothetical protein
LIKDISLTDQADQQTFRFDAKGVTAVKILILKEYTATQGQVISSVAISNLEFRRSD